jgi:hypothetical protein
VAWSARTVDTRPALVNLIDIMAAKLRAVLRENGG